MTSNPVRKVFKPRSPTPKNFGPTDDQVFSGITSGVGKWGYKCNHQVRVIKFNHTLKRYLLRCIDCPAWLDIRGGYKFHSAKQKRLHPTYSD